MADYTKNLLIKLTGDTKSAQTALAEFENAMAKSQLSTANLSAKITADFAKFQEQAAKSAAAIDKIGAASPGLASRLGDTLNARFSAAHPLAGGLLDTAGISASTTAVVGGTALAGAAVVKFGADASKAYLSAAEAVDKFQDVSGASARQSSEFVNAGKLLGVSADELSVALGRMLKGVNANEAAYRSYGVEVARAKDGSVDAVKTFENIAKGFANIPDPAKRAELASMAFGRGWQSIVDVLERGGPQLDALFQRAGGGPTFDDKSLKQALDLNIRLHELGQEWDKLKVSTGEAILPGLVQTIGWIQDTTKAIADFRRETKDLVNTTDTDKLNAWQQGIKGIWDALGGGSGGHGLTSAKDLERQTQNTKQAFGGFSGALSGTRTAADDAGVAAVDLANSLNIIAGGAANAGSGISTLSGYLKAGQADWASYTDSMRTTQSVNTSYQQALDDLDTIQTKSAQTAVNSGQQIADAAQRVADAQKNLAEANESAQQRIIDANEQAAQRIVDAQQRVVDAQQREADGAEQGARRVGDARQHLADTINASLRDANPFDAQRRVDDARASLIRTEEDEAKRQAKDAKDVEKAQKNLADTETQAAKDRAKAQTEASKQIEQATRQVEDAQKQAARATEAAGTAAEITGGQMRDAAGKAQTLVDKTFDLGYQTLLLGGSMQDVWPKLASVKTKLDELGTSGRISWENVAELKRQIDAIPNEINKTFTLHLDASQLRQELLAASLTFVDPNSRANVAAGLELPPGGPLFRDAGGPLPPGLSTVYNGTGATEWVSTPEQMQRMAGSTVINNFNNYAPVFSEYEWAEFVRRANDKGYAGIRG